MKKNIKILIGIILIIIVLIASYFLLFKNNKNNFNEEYTSVEKDNIYVYKTSDAIIKILENGTGIVFLGFPECPWCQSYAPMLNDIAKEEGIKNIYYFNIKEDRANNTENYKKMVSLLDKYLDYDEEGNKRIFVPEVAFVVNGEIVASDNETSLISGETTPDEYWTKDAKQALKVKLTKYINLINDSMCTSCDE